MDGAASRRPKVGSSPCSGIRCKDSAAANVSPETIRARRKRIYRKLDVSGSIEVISALLALSLRMLANGERVAPQPTAAKPAVTEPDTGPRLAAQ
jgi:hypothetical protein